MHLPNSADELIQSSQPVQSAPWVCRLKGNSKLKITFWLGIKEVSKICFPSLGCCVISHSCNVLCMFPQMYFVWYCNDLQRPSLNSGGCPIQAAAGTLGFTSCRFNDIVYYQSILLSPLSSRHLKSWHLMHLVFFSRKANFILGHWKYCRPTHIPFPFNALVSQWQQLIKKYRRLQK